MYFELRPWRFARGVGRRIAGSVAIGLLAAVFGIARLALLGWLAAKVFRGALVADLIGPFALVAAVMLLDFALVTRIAPVAFQRWNSRASRSRKRTFGGSGAEFLDSVQGLAALKAFGQSGDRLKLLDEKARELLKSTMWVVATNTLARGVTDTSIAVAPTPAIGRPAPAHRHRPRVPRGRPGPHPRRGHLAPRRGQRARRPLDDLMRDCTTLVIAHGRSTVRDAERIIVLDDGRVVETGTHEELSAGGGLFAHLVSRQLAGGLRTAAE